MKGLLGFCPFTISVIRSRYFLNWLCSTVVPKIVFPPAAAACCSDPDCYCKCLISAGSWFETCASLRAALLISAPTYTDALIPLLMLHGLIIAAARRLTCEEAREELQDALVHFAEWRTSYRGELPHRLVFPEAETTRHLFNLFTLY